MFGTISHCHFGFDCMALFLCPDLCYCLWLLLLWLFRALSFPCSYDSDRDAVWVDRAVYRAEYKPTLQ